MLLVSRETLLLLDLGLQALDIVRRKHVQGEGLAGALHFDEDGELDFQDEGGILPDAAVLQGPAVLKSVAGEEEPLVVNRDFLLGLESVFVT